MGDLNRQSLKEDLAAKVDSHFARYQTYTLSKINYIFDMSYRMRQHDFGQGEDNLPTESTPKLSMECHSPQQSRCEANDFDSSSVSTSGSLFSDDPPPLASDSSLTDSEDEVPDYETFEEGILRGATTPSIPDYLGGPKHRLWETSWAYRYDILVNLLHVAEDMATSKFSADRALPEHIARLVITSKKVIFDPHKDVSQIEEYVVIGNIKLLQVNSSLFSNVTTNMSELSINTTSGYDEMEDFSGSSGEDLGIYVPPGSSRERAGAILDPSAMFATSNALIREE